MHRTPLAAIVPGLLAGVLVLASCGGDGAAKNTSVPVAPTTTAASPTAAPTTAAPAAMGLAAAATAAQAAIDLGDGLPACPWDMGQVITAVADVAPLVPELADDVDNYGQVFRGGEVDITYCEEYASSDATTGIDEFRIDVHPGTADLPTYLDEEFGAEVQPMAPTEVHGGELRSWCLEEQRCLAVWQGDGLFVALVTVTIDAGVAADAAVALTVALPLVVDGLAA